MPEIQTERLKLIALTLDQLRLCLAAPQQLERELGLPVPRIVMSEPVPRAIGLKIAKMAGAEVKNHPWYTYWLVVISPQTVGAGLVGFKGQPNDQGEVEIGYGIDSAYRNQGYTTEAVKAMIAWAFQQPQCRSIIALDTAKSNIASNRVSEKAGMTVYQETEDTLSWRITRDAAIDGNVASLPDRFEIQRRVHLRQL